MVCGLLGAGCASGRAKPESQLRAASAEDSYRAPAEFLIATLAAGDPHAAERDFSEQLRALLPPAVLGPTWRSMVAQSGALQSFRFVTSEHQPQKARLSFELDFSHESRLALVVFEPSSARVIGLFFSAGKAAERAPPPAASDSQVEELTLTLGAVASLPLAASLTLPRSRGTQRVPGVVLVAGSGPGDRDESSPRARPLRDLAYGLAHHGVATLRFDKRTRAHRAAIDVQHLTVEDEVIADAVSAVRLLAARPEIDPQRIFVVGHSLGGLLAPEIAERAQGVAGLVLLAAPGRPLPEVTLEQLRIRGATPATLAALQAKVDALAQLPPTEILFGVTVNYLRDLAQRDELTRAVRLHVPVLYLRGQLDQNVFAVDQSNWSRALTGQVPFSEVTLPGLDHHFLPARDASELHVPDEVSARIAAFTLL